MFNSIRNDIRLLGFLPWIKDTFIPYSWNFWWHERVRPIYAPQHKELRAAIPKTWADLDYCIPNFLYACVISYVEKEKGLEVWAAQEVGRADRDQVNVLKEVYEWAKTGRQKAYQEHLDMLPSPKEGENTITWLNREDPERDAAYERAHKMEEELTEKDNKYLAWIVNNRRLMWS